MKITFNDIVIEYMHSRYSVVISFVTVKHAGNIINKVLCWLYSLNNGNEFSTMKDLKIIYDNQNFLIFNMNHPDIDDSSVSLSIMYAKFSSLISATPKVIILLTSKKNLLDRAVWISFHVKRMLSASNTKLNLLNDCVLWHYRTLQSYRVQSQNIVHDIGVLVGQACGR